MPYPGETVESMRKYISFFVFIMFVFAPISRTQTSSPAEPRYPISQGELKTSLQEIESLLKEGALLEAKTRYETLIQYDLSAEDRQLIRKALEELNLKILFSPAVTPDSFLYTVQPGDALYKIAKDHHTTAELIKKSNHLMSDLIRPGMELKISKAVYSILVDKSENKIELFSDETLLKTYSIATGREGHPTPIGSFTIVNKLIDPTWYKTGAVLPPDSPDNILGTRWLGFSLPSYGIHGTTLPETIGTSASEGCIRMHNHDVEELYTIVPIGATVTVAD